MIEAAKNILALIGAGCVVCTIGFVCLATIYMFRKDSPEIRNPDSN